MSYETIQTKLLSGERILWSGAPVRGLLLMPRDAFLIPFTFAWLAFALIWMWGADGGFGGPHPPAFFLLWGGMFVLIGLFMAVGRFPIDAWLRARTSYAVTDRRILIVRGAPFAQFTSLDLVQMPEVSVQGETQSRGALRFGNTGWVTSRNNPMELVPALQAVPQFLAIDNPGAVMRLILEAKAKAR
jgi:hypothetical protein